MTTYLFTCSQLPTYLAIPSFIYILHFSKFVYMHFQATFYLFHHLTSLTKEHMHLHCIFKYVQLKFIITSFLCFFKPLCKTLEQPKASSLACPHVSHMSFKQHLKLPSRHPSIVGSIKGKLAMTFLCLFSLLQVWWQLLKACHHHYLFFFSLKKKKLCCVSGIKFQAYWHVFCFCFMFFCETRAM